jgi:hypothetical protein
MASMRRSTKKQCSAFINRWMSFCRKRQVDAFQTTISYVIEFLTELIHQVTETINTAR